LIFFARNLVSSYRRRGYHRSRICLNHALWTRNGRDEIHIGSRFEFHKYIGMRETRHGRSLLAVNKKDACDSPYFHVKIKYVCLSRYAYLSYSFRRKQILPSKVNYCRNPFALGGICRRHDFYGQQQTQIIILLIMECGWWLRKGRAAGSDWELSLFLDLCFYIDESW
jgi:hypothetical protein